MFKLRDKMSGLIQWCVSDSGDIISNRGVDKRTDHAFDSHHPHNRFNLSLSRTFSDETTALTKPPRERI